MNLSNFIATAIQNNGASYSINTGTLNPTTGYLVSRDKYGHKSATLTKKELKSYIQRHAHILNIPGHYVGLWRDNGTWYYDISVMVYSVSFACIVGINEKQLAIFDCRNSESIYLPQMADFMQNLRMAIESSLPMLDMYGIQIEIPSPQTSGTNAQNAAYSEQAASNLTTKFYNAVRLICDGVVSRNDVKVTVYN